MPCGSSPATASSPCATTRPPASTSPSRGAIPQRPGVHLRRRRARHPDDHFRNLEDVNAKPAEAQGSCRIPTGGSGHGAPSHDEWTLASSFAASCSTRTRERDDQGDFRISALEARGPTASRSRGPARRTYTRGAGAGMNALRRSIGDRKKSVRIYSRRHPRTRTPPRPMSSAPATTSAGVETSPSPAYAFHPRSRLSSPHSMAAPSLSGSLTLTDASDDSLFALHATPLPATEPSSSPRFPPGTYKLAASGATARHASRGLIRTAECPYRRHCCEMRKPSVDKHHHCSSSKTSDVTDLSIQLQNVRTRAQPTRWHISTNYVSIDSQLLIRIPAFTLPAT